VVVDALEPADPLSIARDEGDALLGTAAAVTSGDHAPLDDAIRSGIQPVAAVVPVATSRRSLVRIVAAAGTREERVDRGAFFVLPLTGALAVSGPGVTHARVTSGPVGLILDARPRPLALPQRDAERVPAVSRWYESVGALVAEGVAR